MASARTKRAPTGKKISRPFGWTLIADFYGVSPERLANRRLFRIMLEDLPELIGMRTISIVKVLRADDTTIPGYKPEDFGLSGGVYISTSHIAAHGWTRKGFLHIVVDSCKKFPARKVIACIRKHFGFTSVDHEMHTWGKRFYAQPLLPEPPPYKPGFHEVREEYERIRENLARSMADLEILIGRLRRQR